MDIFLLLSEELGTHGIQRVTPEFVIALHDLKHVQLKPAIEHGLFRVPLTVSFGVEVGVLDLGFDVWKRLGVKHAPRIAYLVATHF